MFSLKCLDDNSEIERSITYAGNYHGDYKNENEPRDASHFYSDKMNKTKIASRYIIGIVV